ncbi:MAG: hypothetical protein AAFY52_00180 [Pseudomonadota bacterium]
MEVIWFIIVAIAIIVPMFKLLPHFGLSPYWAFFCILPIGVIVLLWVMALKLNEMEKR